MSLIPIIRRAAFVASFIMGSLVAAFSAAAQQATDDRNADACKTLGSTKAGVRCAIKEMDRRIGTNNAAAATAREQEACGQFLLKGVDDKKWTKPEILAEAGGSFTPQNVCAIATKRGYKPVAGLQHK